MLKENVERQFSFDSRDDIGIKSSSNMPLLYRLSEAHFKGHHMADDAFYKGISAVGNIKQLGMFAWAGRYLFYLTMRHSLLMNHLMKLSNQLADNP